MEYLIPFFLSYDFKNLIYVDENGNDITGDGSLLNPYQSAQQGLKVLENGMKIGTTEDSL